jgi:hypothetical protein
VYDTAGTLLTALTQDSGAGCCATLDWDAVSPDGSRLFTSAFSGSGSSVGTTTIAYAAT